MACLLIFGKEEPCKTFFAFITGDTSCAIFYKYTILDIFQRKIFGKGIIPDGKISVNSWFIHWLAG